MPASSAAGMSTLRRNMMLDMTFWGVRLSRELNEITVLLSDRVEVDKVTLERLLHKCLLPK
jgi:hypothetical protein